MMCKLSADLQGLILGLLRPMGTDLHQTAEPDASKWVRIQQDAEACASMG